MSNFAGWTAEAANITLDRYAGIPLIERLISKIKICSPHFFDDGVDHFSHWVNPGSAVKGLIIMQALGMTNYADIESLFNNSTLFTRALDGKTFSQETLRQKLNMIAQDISIIDRVDESNVQLLKGQKFYTVSYCGKEYIPLDIDVTPFANPKVKKEGISHTYKKIDGFAPITAYIGQFALAFELRPGSQHSENGAIPFLKRCVNLLTLIGIDPQNVILRVDSGHDAHDFRDAAKALGLNFIMKANPRSTDLGPIVAMAKTVDKGTLSTNKCDMKYYCADPSNPISVKESYTRALYEVRDPVKDPKTGEDPFALFRVTDPSKENFGKDGVPYKVAILYTNLPLPEGSEQTDPHGIQNATEIVELYHQHATSEQFHSELKTDMDMELLPSHHFKTNALFLALSVISFNVLRIIGDKALGYDSSLQHHKNKETKRLRNGTVIELFMKHPCQVVWHARKKVIRIGKKSPIRRTFLYLMSA